MICDPLNKAIEKLGPADQRRQARAAIKRAKAEGWADWIRGVVDLRAMLEGYYFDVEKAERVKAFFEQILRIKDPDDPTGSQPFVLLDWQYYDVLGPLFGWCRPDGKRRFNRGQIWIPKKNGKTELAAGIDLYMLVADGEPEPEVYSAATTREQASLVYRACKRMLDRSTALQRVVTAKDHVKRLVFNGGMGHYAVLPNKPAAVDGINAHAIIFDELHRQKNRELWDALHYATINRTQPLHLTISTAGDDLESIGYEQFETAQQIISGDVIQHNHFAYVAAAQDGDDWTDPEIWKRANPSIGVTVSIEEMAQACQAAQDNPAEEANFKRLRLNLWVGRGASFLDMELWRAITDRWDIAELAGLVCNAGLDLSSNTDLTSLLLRFKDADGNSRPLCFNWIPEECARKREKIDGVPYGVWIDEGYVETTPGDHIDLDHIRLRINEIGEQYEITEIAYDPTFASQLSVQLANDGFNVFRFRQAASMTTPVLAELDRLVRVKKLIHNANPVLTWAASNLHIRSTSDGLMKPVKVSRAHRIDPIVALLMSLGVDCKESEDDGPSVYEEYGEPEAEGAVSKPRPAGTASVYEEY